MIDIKVDNKTSRPTDKVGSNALRVVGQQYIIYQSSALRSDDIVNCAWTNIELKKFKA